MKKGKEKEKKLVDFSPLRWSVLPLCTTTIRFWPRGRIIHPGPNNNDQEYLEIVLQYRVPEFELEEK